MIILTQKTENKPEVKKGLRRKAGKDVPLTDSLGALDDTKKGPNVAKDECTNVDPKGDKNSVWNALSKEELIEFITESLPKIEDLSNEAETAMATIRKALEQIGNVTKTSEEAQKAQAALDRLNLQFRELKESLGIDQVDDAEILDVQKAFAVFVKHYVDSITVELVNQNTLLAQQNEQAELAHATALEQKDREIQAILEHAAAAEKKAAALEERNKQFESLAKVGAAFVTALNGAKLEPKQFVAQMLETKTKVEKLDSALNFIRDQFAALLEIMQDVVKYVRNVIVSVFKGQKIENVAAMLEDLDAMDGDLTSAIKELAPENDGETVGSDSS